MSKNPSQVMNEDWPETDAVHLKFGQPTDVGEVPDAETTSSSRNSPRDSPKNYSVAQKTLHSHFNGVINLNVAMSGTSTEKQVT
ncbi:hypothetical protein SBOR_1503 [Sclerotinia borealis F-4128]|uniref:Uncharacterized protein n=1 Tax=Sclerotinia borealis (strain F-4128) TaxID=1432307 RepID=W9CU62_SCLBF|nr:hypothetical protein SBOR_1503 [Sclerotinia borealis F-4128]